jgi:aminoglycoside 6'-N-acetyltransferase
MIAEVGEFRFRRLTRDDFGLLGRWLAEPHVARWWNHDPRRAALETDFGPSIDGEEPAEDFVVELDGQPIGVIQSCRFADYPEYVVEIADVMTLPEGAYSIDYFVGEPDLVGRGIGTAAIRAFAERLWIAQPDATAIVVPVNSENVASWRALQRAGFRLVARGELKPDNPADDPMHEVFQLDRPG